MRNFQSIFFVIQVCNSNKNIYLQELLKMQNKEKCYLKNKLKSFYEAEQAFRDHAQDIICQYQKRE